MPAMQHRAGAADSAHLRRMMDLYMRMMADSVIRRRVMADSTMSRLMHEMMTEMPAEHRKHMRGMMEDGAMDRARTHRPAMPAREAEPKDSVAHHEH
jgi:hypothetical protein